MCLIAFSWQPGGRRPLLLLANRDEFYDRPTAPAQWWPDHPHIWGGRDLQAGGSWLGLTRGGRFAAITNHRDGRAAPLAAARSRGELVADFLAGSLSPQDYMAGVMARRHGYQGFNLLVGDLIGGELWYGGNREGADARPLAPGLYGLSNAVLDSPWPKVERLKQGLAALATDHSEAEALALLGDKGRAADEALPDTGISREWERALSAVFIVHPGYGTRAQTLVSLAADGSLSVVELGFNDERQGRALQPDRVRRLQLSLRKKAEPASGQVVGLP
ncbi:NRDE family protein [Zobellella sp. CGMCC 1.18722]|uniref:NRDE family protein n=1 Tax=Zobellella iuensis TaxID=2803811 RepID=A0ABS1QTF6_9GAMM|nr:NRDE family protein [Zobellella iuensis]